MRAVFSIVAVVALVGSGSSDSDKRYEQAVDLKKYPQASPKEALASFIKCINNKDIEYFVAQVAEPKFVDQRVKDLGGHFEEVVKEARQKLVDDPATLKLLGRLAQEGEWKTEDDRATVSLTDVPDKAVHFVKNGSRWYVENRFGS
jgi:hypothetical protein